MINTNYQAYNPSFGASCAGKITIKAKNEAGKFVPKDARVAILNVNYFPDFRAIRKLSNFWERKTGGHIISSIFDYAQKDVAKVNENYPYRVYYAVTTQDGDLKKLDPKKILGIATVLEKDNAKNHTVSWLQVNPFYNYSAKGHQRKYKNIGEQLIKFIREYGGKPLETNAEDDTVNFYKKIGFTPFTNEKYHMYMN